MLIISMKLPSDTGKRSDYISKYQEAQTGL